jgi:hypothetical protein
MPEDLSKTLARNLNETDKIQSEQVKQDTISNYFILTDYKFHPYISNVKIQERTIGDALIIGHSTNGIIGAAAANVIGTVTMGSWVSLVDDSNPYNMTTYAREQIAKFLAGESTTVPEKMALGDGTTAATEYDTDLVSEWTRESITASTSTSKTIVFTGYFVDYTETLNELGIFDTWKPGWPTEWGTWGANADICFFRYKLSSSISMIGSKQYWVEITTKLEDQTQGSAVICDVGLNEVRDWFGGGSGDIISHTEINDSQETPDITHTYSSWDTGSTAEQRNAIQTKTRAAAVVTYETSFSKTDMDGEEVYKSGSFTAASDGIIYGQTLYGKISKTSLFQIFEIDRYTVR